ncbi:MAG: molybdopterin molybdotransferase MoeA [Campylobacter lanienae]|nr:molybdopterin molybdotransferase MoeA [Campylobacteraceae bacterium]MDY2817796.1 molybdopterin molybdotransferase MoeA [Campylobacter lanienae]
MKQVSEVFKLISNLEFPRNTETISIFKAFGRVSSKDIFARRDLPLFDNSALDGYAFDFANKDEPLEIVGSVFAGDEPSFELRGKQCAKIMTGAKFPKGANSVVAFEDASFDERGFLLVPKNTKQDNARKLKGEEVKSGELLLKSGTKLGAKELMLLSAQGICQISVFKEPKIALLCLGSEIKEPWQSASQNQIYNANAAGIITLLSAKGFACDYLGIIKDSKDTLALALQKALKYDIIITTAGASKGEADYAKECLEAFEFSCLLDSINFRPSKPTKIFRRENKIAIALPGNPLSAYAACLLFVLPILRRFCGEQKCLNQSYEAVLSEDVKLNPTRDNLLIGKVENAVFSPYNAGKFSPSQIMPLVRNNAISVIPAGTAELKAKNLIKFYKIY